MTLAELKKLLDAAKLALEADPENAELKTKVEEAQAAYDAKAGEEGGDEGGEPDESKLDAKTLSYIKKLRKEAADNRAKKKDLASQLKASEEQKRKILAAAGITDESEAPEEKLKKTTAANETLAFRNAILEKAIAFGVANDQVKYFQFLVMDKMEALEDGEELSDEDLQNIASQCKKAGKGSGNTSVNGKGGKSGEAPPPEGGNAKTTLPMFLKMNMGEKEAFYKSNPDEYKAFVAEARRTNRLI